MRGGSVFNRDQAYMLEGRSPRARGKRCRRCFCRECVGSIPACAGEASRSFVFVQAREVDPRVRGGSGFRHLGLRGRGGRSPRARGKLRRAITSRPSSRSIPACAGEAARTAQRQRRGRVDPRVRGGSKSNATENDYVKGRSPRARGKRCRRCFCRECVGSIPACAGEALHQRRDSLPREVDPRVRGGS